MQFRNKKHLAHYLLDRMLPHADTHRERLAATFYAVQKSEELWAEYAE